MQLIFDRRNDLNPIVMILYYIIISIRSPFVPLYRVLKRHKSGVLGRVYRIALQPLQIHDIILKNRQVHENYFELVELG